MRNNATAPNGGNTCFRCGEAGHYANRCPKGNGQNTPGQFNNSGQRQTPQQQQPRNNNQTPQSNKGQQNFVRGRINHVAAETAQEAQDVVFSMFLVNSALHQFYLIPEHRIHSSLLSTLLSTPFPYAPCLVPC
jgi:hypothetical protein